MNGRILVDTNVLVYAYDRSESAKQKRAIEILDYLVTTGRGLLSAQILAEFFWVMTKKIPEPLTVHEAERRIQNYLRSWSVEPITPLIVLEAIRGVREHHLSFWDAQIWATALLTQSSLILSEDFSDGASLEGIRSINPFTPSFQPAQLG